MVSLSSGIREIRHIQSFLGVDRVVSPREVASKGLSPSAVIVWGRKKSSHRAVLYARRMNLPVVFVEDGWIRSCSKNAHSRISYSLLIDRVGVYYDSTVPSELEQFLNLADEKFDLICDQRQLEYSARWRNTIVESDITKYNYCSTPHPDVLDGDGRNLILVIDQTSGDASVEYGGLGHLDFRSLLDRAISENPDARVVVRTHPDVVTGKRKGYLSEYARTLGVEVSAQGDNPIPWLKRAERVYVGTSQLGYEALLCGCRVSVAGSPFYSGWGLTDDWQTQPRRTRSRTLDQLFFATHVHFARYRSPLSGAVWQLHDCVQHVLIQKENFELNAASFVCVGVTPWKRRYIAQYLRSPDGEIRFSKDKDADGDERLVCWSYKLEDAKDASHDDSIHASTKASSDSSIIRIEDGFLRSQGLGSDFVAPSSLVFDDAGLYFDPEHPSQLENLLNNYELCRPELERAASLRQKILQSNLTKYNVSKSQVADISVFKDSDSKQTKVLVVGQVEDDQSILRGCGDTNTNTKLIERVRSMLPDSYIVYKPHPDVTAGNRRGNVSTHILDKTVDRVETSVPFLECLADCDELHTMTSLSGFEALLRHKRVVVHGLPFYAGWGLTTDMLITERRKKQRSVEELLFLTLVKYPRYLDIDSGEFITPEQLVECLGEQQRRIKPENFRFLEKLNNIRKAMFYSS